MATAKINIPGGIVVEVEGTPDEITVVLDKLKSKAASPLTGVAVDRRLGNFRGEISGLIESLKSEEFFTAPRGLSDIQKRLAEIGHHYPLTTLSGAMQTQSRKRNLRRFKRDGKYVYVQ